MKISYLVGVHNESVELKFLLNKLISNITSNHPTDEIVILDDYSTDVATVDILNWTKQFSFIKILQNHLNGDFGSHKTVGSRACSGDYIVNFDADEYPSDGLLENLHVLIESNPTIELYLVPRVNIVRGITEEDRQKWGWHVGRIQEFGDLPIINWLSGDHQARIYKNDVRIHWYKKVHESVTGHTTVAKLPIEVECAIIHDKTIDRQRIQNTLYSTLMTK